MVELRTSIGNAHKSAGTDQRADTANRRSRRAPRMVKGRHMTKYSAPTIPKTVSGSKDLIGDDVAGAREFGETHDRCQRGALDQLYKEADRRGQRDTERLRQDDVLRARYVSEAEGLCGLGLAARNRLDRSPPDLAEVGAGMKRQADGDGNPGVEPQTHQRQPVIDDEELHQKRCSLEDRNVAGRHALEQRYAGGSCERDAEACNAATDEADHGQDNGPFQADQEEDEFIGTHETLLLDGILEVVR
jgi:hypothetical protein